MVKRADMMDVKDVLDLLSIELIGVVPDDESIISTTNKGEPAVSSSESLAGSAFKNIASRVEGNDIPFLDLDIDNNFVGKLKKMFGFTH